MSTQKHTTTSRRTFLAAVSATGATVMPAAATALGGLATSVAGDAELLALAPQFEPLFAEWQSKRMAEWRDRCEIESRTAEALGPAASKPIGTDARTLKDPTGKAFGLEIHAAGQKPEGQITEVS